MPPRAILKEKEDRRLTRGHCWAYRNEFAKLPTLEDGETVDVFSDRGGFVGRGFYQTEGGIAVRLLARHQVSVDADFFRERVASACRFRERCFPGETVYRWVFGESDGLPGFIADRYGPLVAAQTSCAFYEGWAEALAESFLACEGVHGVRLAVRGRVHRYGDTPESVPCSVDGIHVAVDTEAGQKTGLFLDQRVNQHAARRYAAGSRVLDGHCYVGLWSCHAAQAGAVSVLGADTSGAAIERARENASRNGLDGVCAFEHADIADVLARADRDDLNILDPPALAKSRAHLRNALGCYQTLNANAMTRLEPGGILVTSSCSHFVDREAFIETLKRAAAAVQRQVWLVDARGASPDHPVLAAMPETAYLTCVTLRVL